MGFSTSTNSLIVIGITILILLVIQRLLYNVGFEIGSIRFLGLSGISVKKPIVVRIHSLYLEFFKHGKWITLTLFQPTLECKLPNSNGNTNGNTRPKKDLKEILHSLKVWKSVLLWLNIPWIARRFAISVDQICISISTKDDKKVWNVRIQHALMTFAITRPNRKQMNLACCIQLQDIELLDASIENDFVLIKANVSIDVVKDLQQDLIFLPEFKIHISDTVMHTSPFIASLAHMNSSESPLTTTKEIPIGFLADQSRHFWTLITTFQPHVSLFLSTIHIYHEMNSKLGFYVKLDKFEFISKVNSPKVESFHVHAHMSLAEIQITLHEKHNSILYVDKINLNVDLKPPLEKWTSQLETTRLVLEIGDVKLDVNDVLLQNIQSLKSFKEEHSSLSKQTLQMKPILRELYQLFSLSVQIQITHLSLFFSALEYENTNSCSFFIKIMQGNINFSTNSSLESFNQSTCRIILGDISFTNIHFGMIHHHDLNELFDSDSDVSSLSKSRKIELGLVPSGKFNCDVSIQETEENNYLSRLFYVFIQGTIDSIQVSLTDIRDEPNQPRYKLLLLYLESLFQKLSMSKKPSSSSSLPFVLDTSIECALLRIDCKSDLPATGIRLDSRDLNVKSKYLGKAETLELKFQLGTCSLISFLANKGSETFRSTKNILLKCQGINGIFTKVGSTTFPNGDVQIDHGQSNLSLVDSMFIHYRISFKTIVYVCIISLQHVLRIAKVIQNKDKNKPLAKVRASIRMDRFDWKINLGHDVLVKLHIYPLKMLIQEQSVQVCIEDFGAGVMVDSQTHRFESIGHVKEFEFKFIKSPVILTNKSPFTLSAEAHSLHLNIPHDYRLEHVFENMIDMSKGIKELAIQYLEFVPDPYCKDGTTRIDPSEIPVIHASIQKIVLTIQDDPFEIRLGQNYHKGLEEQSARISRDKAFEKQALLRKEMNQKSLDNDTIAR